MSSRGSKSSREGKDPQPSRTLPPPAPSGFTPKFDELPESIQKVIEKAKIDHQLLNEYPNHMHTVTKFLLRDQYPPIATSADRKRSTSATPAGEGRDPIPEVRTPEKRGDKTHEKHEKPDKSVEKSGDHLKTPSGRNRTESNSKKSSEKKADKKDLPKAKRESTGRARPYALPTQIEAAISTPPKPLKKLYKQTHFAGKGGFGDVVVAKDLKAPKKRQIALKKLNHNTERTRENNYTEIAFLSQCQHPNICGFEKAYLVDDKKDGEHIYLVLEFMEGGTLSQAAAANALSDEHIAFTAGEILKALDYLHGRNWVHRDLKSANVMMSIKGEIKLIDFGLCADFSEGPRTQMVGADVWSMAVCILELFNANPVHADSAVKCMFYVATRPIVPYSRSSHFKGLLDQIPDSATPLARNFLSSALVQNPETRGTVKELLKDPWVKRANLNKGFDEVLRQVFLSDALNGMGL